MSAEELSPQSSYFRIRGGDTVLEARSTGWIRWDRWDGPVATSIWTADRPELIALTEAEARGIIAAH